MNITNFICNALRLLERPISVKKGFPRTFRLERVKI